MASFPFGWNPPSLDQIINKCQTKYGAELVTLDHEVEESFGRVYPRLISKESG